MMKKNILFYSIIICFLSISCAEKCENYTTYYRSAAVDRYADAFDIGNSWIYTNQDGTKTDSVWIFREDGAWYGEYTNKTVCDKFYVRNLKINSQYMLAYMSEVRYTAVYYRCDENYTSLSFSVLYNPFTIIKGTDSVDTVSMHINDGYLSSGNTIVIDSILYKDVININNKCWLAPNVGIIKYVSAFNYKDTFNLKKSYLK